MVSLQYVDALRHLCVFDVDIDGQNFRRGYFFFWC